MKKDGKTTGASGAKQWVPWVALVLILGGIGFSVWEFSPSMPSSPAAKNKALLQVSSTDWTKGNKNAPATLVEYMDFQCPACGAYYPLVKQLTDAFKDNMLLVVRYFPLIQIHQNAMAAARAAEAAGRQGKYWEMHDSLFSNQTKWAELRDPQDTFVAYAEQAGANKDQFLKDLADTALVERIQKDMDSGTQLGVNGTPTFFLNGEQIKNPSNLDDFKALVQAAILNAPAPQSANEQAFHIHADFKVYIHGKAIDFSSAQYQSTDQKELDPNIHLHDGNGNTIHIHKEGITMGNFFKSLGMDLTKNCFTLDTKKQYCAGGGNTLKFYVNGKPNDSFGDYVMNDLDRILISYGSENGGAIAMQLASVTDNACLYSLKCPERGTPPTEKCVGGLGTKCN